MSTENFKLEISLTTNLHSYLEPHVVECLQIVNGWVNHTSVKVILKIMKIFLFKKNEHNLFPKMNLKV